MPKHAITIDVLGCSIPISADEDAQYLKNLLEKYRNKIDETIKATGIRDPLKAAVLTGFLLSDECEKIRGGLAHNEDTGNASRNNRNNDNNSEKNETANSVVNSAEVQDESREAEKITLNLISRLGSLLGIKDTTEEKIIIKPVPDEKKIHKLDNPVKNYSWGSPDWIPDLLNKKNEEHIPWAELWMGVHPEGPSSVMTHNRDQHTRRLLKDLIENNPAGFLGSSAGFNTLPFLFKVLAAYKPLSIQAHPNLKQAWDGYDRENNDEIPLDSALRNYKDANHKPEMLCAISPFTLMAGFRHPTETKNLLGSFLEKAPRDLKAAFFPLFNTLDEENALKKFLNALFSLPHDIKMALSSYAKQKNIDEWPYIPEFAASYPGDPSIISPLYLNLIKLNPGEAVFIPAGVLHSYIYGLGIELMANSDNVLRGGLTTKHIDFQELFRILDFRPFVPAINNGAETAGVIRYAAFAREFSLSIIKGGRITYPETGPSIILVSSGELEIITNEETVFLRKGESAFIPANDKGFCFNGEYSLYAAGIPNNLEIV